MANLSSAGAEATEPSVIVHERLVSNALEEHDRQVILVKNPSIPSGPSNFPIAPHSGGRPSSPVSGVNPY